MKKFWHLIFGCDCVPVAYTILQHEICHCPICGKFYVVMMFGHKEISVKDAINLVGDWIGDIHFKYHTGGTISWWFWDETWNDHGPYEHYDEAKEGLRQYCFELSGVYSGE